MDLVKAVIEFTEGCGQMDDMSAAARINSAAFYTGMQCEELAEKLREIKKGCEQLDVWFAASPLKSDLATCIHHLETLGTRLKGRAYNHAIGAMTAEQRKEMLDGDVDLAWVSIGGAISSGANFQEAADRVSLANLSKRFPDGTFHRDPATTKVLKPDGWKPADLTGLEATW